MFGRESRSARESGRSAPRLGLARGTGTSARPGNLSTLASLRPARTCFLAIFVGMVASARVHGVAAQQPQVLSLQDAIALAERANPESAMANIRERQARADLRAARSAMLPKLDASESFTDSTDPVFAFGARLRQGRFTANDFSPANLNYPSATADFASGLGATWEMFDSGRAFRQADAARSTVKATAEQREATRQEIAYQVVRAYDRALLAEQEKRTTAAAVARARSFSKEVHDRVQAGMALASEGLQADVDLSQREQEAADAESNASLAYADLGGVMGQTSASFALLGPTGTPPDVASTLEELQEKALQTRSDIAAARSRTAAAAQAERASHDAYGPSFSSFANVEADNPHLTGGGNTNWTVGAKAEIRLFDGGTRRAAASKASAEREMAEASLAQAETQANLQVRRAFYAVQSARRQYVLSNQMLAKSQETLRTTLDRYEAGLATITEVLGQQDGLRSVELDRVESLYRWRTAEAQLRLASGADIATHTGTRP